MSSSRSAWSGRSTSSLALTSRWTSLGGGLLMQRIIALDLDQSRDYSLDFDPRVDYSLYCDPSSAQPQHLLRHSQQRIWVNHECEMDERCRARPAGPGTAPRLPAPDDPMDRHEEERTPQ